MSDETKNKPALEDNFAELEDILKQMEQPEISLEQSFLLYQSGVEKLKECNVMLDTVEKKMQILNAKGELAGAFAFGGENVQAKLLQAEGVEVKNGKVNLKIYGILIMWHWDICMGHKEREQSISVIVELC